MLKIDKAEASVTNINLRKEQHGEDLHKALDVTVELTIINSGQLVMEALAPTISAQSWDENGEPNLVGLDIALDHKVESCKAEFMHALGDPVVVFAQADLKSIKVVPMSRYSLSVKLTVQSLAAGEDVDPLWDMLKGKGARVTIHQHRRTDDGED